WKSHVSGIPRFPSAPSDCPFRVKNVAPDDPVRTSIDVWPVNVRTFPSVNVLPDLTVGSSFPSTQTLIQADEPLIDTTRFPPLYGTETCRVSVVDDVSFAALTEIVHRPVVSWSGLVAVSHVPSLMTGTLTVGPPLVGAPLAPGAGDGVGDTGPLPTGPS